MYFPLHCFLLLEIKDAYIMLNISLIESKDCIEGQCKYRRVKGGDNIRGPQREVHHKNLSRVHKLIKQGPEQNPFKPP